MTGTWKRRAAGLGLAGCLFLGAVVAHAGAVSSLDEALHMRKDMMHKILDLQVRRHDRRLQIQGWIDGTKRRLAKLTRVVDDRTLHGSTRHVVSKQQAQVHRLKMRKKSVIKAIRARLDRLKASRKALADWIATYVVFRYCPVDGPHSVANNFGVMVNIPGVPPHIHQGNDISAPSGTPIVAPFDGTAVANNNDLGGLAVDVYGALGHVYNAHLSSYGKLGPVNAGDVIGYVGTTGDATSPHDHFEWHPNDGAAVDPNPFLMTVC
jgi:murein DD-endopeptidase MepM/ murein hydrolase activator NlpD